MVPTARDTSPRPRMVVVAADVVGTQMAGPGIRVVSIARELARVADVTLAVGTPESELSVLSGEPFDIVSYDHPDKLVPLVEASDIAFCQITDENVVRRGVAAGCRFIFDLYNALPAEAIGSDRIGGFDTQPQMDDVFRNVLSFFRLCMTAGSYFVTSNERQRDFWIGYMLAAGGLLPSNLNGRDVGDIVGLVPFGMEAGEPASEVHPLRGQGSIAADDLILLWAGGIWDWFDAETPIRAVAAVRAEHPEVRLVFYGTTHPNPLVGRPRNVERAMTLAAELGVLDDGVHFIDGWVPAAERAGYLLDADVAVSAHKESFETRYAFRTRILDHFWASLPSLVTEGDWFADYITQHDLGEVVGYGDVTQTAEAIVRLADPARRDIVRAHIAPIRDQWRWASTTADLVDAVAHWQTRLLPRTLAEVAATPPALPHRSRLRERVSRSPLGALYRALRKRLAR